jgi:hypothetical protein
VSGEAVIDITCERCRKNRKDVSLDRRRLAQVMWVGPAAQARVSVSKRLNQEGVERWALPGQPAGTRTPAVVTDRDVMEFVAVGDDEPRKVHCRGCGAGFSYSRLEWAARAGPGRKKAGKGKWEVGIQPNLGRPRV